MSPLFAALRIRNYRLYTAGGVVSNTGTWMQRVAQDWLVLQLTHNSGTALGITTGLQFLPLLLLSPWGGVLADRYPKRRLLVCTQLAMASTALALGVLDTSGVVRVWHVYLLALLLGVGTAIDNPARQSFVVEMVGREDLPNAVGLNSASFNAARIVGPAVAGVLIHWIGTGPVFFVNAVSFLAVLTALGAMDERALHASTPVPRGKGQLREGVRYVVRRPDIVFVLIVVFFVGTFGLNFQMTTALMATGVYHKGPAEYGLLGSVMAVGSLAGALLGARRGRPRLRLITSAGVVFGCLEVASGLMPAYWMFAVSLIPVGMAALTLITAANATLQLAVSPEVRGRVMALYTCVFFGGTPLGAPLLGWVANVAGARWALIIGGGVSALATATAALLLVRRRHLVVRASLRGRPWLDVRTAEQERQAVSAAQQA